MKLYIGNLPNSITEQELQDLFAPFGEITSINIIKDKFTGQPRGFAFIEMGQAESAQSAIAELDGKEVKGRRMRVSEAQPRPERSGGGNGYGSSRPGGFSNSRGGGAGGRPQRSGGRSGFDGGQNSRSAW